MSTIYLEPNDPAAQKLNAATFRYSGRTFQARVHEHGGMSLTSYWDGGSKSNYRVVELATMKSIPIPENGSGFTAVDRAYGPAGLPLDLPAAGYAVVEHSIFCGKDTGITIHLHAENAAALLPAPVELTWEERVVLAATKSLKSSYAGISDYRYHEAHRETRITRAEYDAAKGSLIARGMLNKAGAVTVAGKNAKSGDLWRLKRERCAHARVGTMDDPTVYTCLDCGTRVPREISAGVTL
jgi:hypothetical protein